MTRTKGVSQYEVATGTLAATALTASAADISGNWKATADFGGQTIERTFVFKVEGTKLTGETTSSMMGKSTITDGKVEGDNVTFNITVKFQDNETKLTYKGKVERGRQRNQVHRRWRRRRQHDRVERQEDFLQSKGESHMKWLLVLIALFAFTASAADITGTWKASTAATGRNTFETTFVFKVDGAKVTGTTSNQMMGETPISEGKIDGDNLSFAGERQFQRQRVQAQLQRQGQRAPR